MVLLRALAGPLRGPLRGSADAVVWYMHEPGTPGRFFITLVMDVYFFGFAAVWHALVAAVDYNEGSIMLLSKSFEAFHHTVIAPSVAAHIWSFPVFWLTRLNWSAFRNGLLISLVLTQGWAHSHVMSLSWLAACLAALRVLS